MKTIEERAKEYVEKHRSVEACYFTPAGSYSYHAERVAYEVGATEQKAIDIEKAKTAFGKACGWLSTYPWYNGVFEEFIKNIEE